MDVKTMPFKGPDLNLLVVLDRPDKATAPDGRSAKPGSTSCGKAACQWRAGRARQQESSGQCSRVLPVNRTVGESTWRAGRRARPDGATSNELFEVLADWNTRLEHLKPEVSEGAGP